MASLAEKQPSICPDLLLYKCVAHFMGRKAPSSSIDGIESIQKPLSEIYSADPCSCMTKDIARDVHLLVFTNGIYAIPANPIDPKIWIPMQNFRNCAAVKGVGKLYDPAYAQSLIFFALDSPEASSSPLPAIFTVTSSRGNCIPLLDCYVFSCPSDEVALTMVEKSRQAFSDRSGWSNKQPPVTMLDINNNFSDEKFHCKTEDNHLECNEQVNPELFQKPSLHGFYYAPKSDIIRTFDIGIEAEAYPLPKVDIEPQRTELCPQYIIINQGNSVNNHAQPSAQSIDKETDPSANLKNIAVNTAPDGHQIIHPQLIGHDASPLPHLVPEPSTSLGNNVASTPTSHHDFDSYNLQAYHPQSYILPANGYYPTFLLDHSLGTPPVLGTSQK